MTRFFSENWGTLLVLAAVLAAAALVAWNMYKQKKAGRSGCGCGCADCPSKGICHPEGQKRSDGLDSGPKGTG